MKLDNKLLPALAILVGTIIGAGFLGIPYVVAKSGFIPGIFLLLFVFLFMLITKLYLGEVILRTRGNNQLTGYAKKYLGKWGEILMFFAMIFGIYSALIAYLIGEGRSLSYLFFGNFNFGFIFSLLFWMVLSYFTFIGLRALKKYEKISMFLVMFLFILITIRYGTGIQIENLVYSNKTNLFLPFGVILFSFLGFSAMPEVERIMRGREKHMKEIIILGLLIPLLAYSIFTLIIVGNFGLEVNEIATLSLGRFYSLLGIFTMFTAYFVLSIAIRDMFRFDLKLGRLRGWALSSFVPLIIFIFLHFLKLDSFAQILGIAGVVSGGLTGILILIMNYKSKRKGTRNPEYQMKINKIIIFILSLIFILAVFLELFI
jgi:amino acid permease